MMDLFEAIRDTVASDVFWPATRQAVAAMGLGAVPGFGFCFALWVAARHDRARQKDTPDAE